MKEIKYKCVDKKNNQMVEVKDLSFVNGLLNEINTSTYVWFREKFSDIVLIEYTQMNDKHGRDIYDGDICKCLGTTENFGDIYLTGIMKWYDEDKRYTIQFSSEIEFSNVKEVEVIGNTFITPISNG